MQFKKSKKLYHVELEFLYGVTRTVTVKASDRETAERRARKFNPKAIGVKREV